MDRSNERGIALIIALFMVLVLSVLGSSLMFISQSETWSSANYRITSQARYAAESGVHRAANFLLNSYTAPATTIELANYDMTVSPVRSLINNRPVVLSYDTTASNYPDAAVQTAFAAATQGTLTLNTAPATYKASATLISMQQYNDPYSGQPKTIQTWDIAAVGDIAGPRSSKVEVSAIVEQQLVPLYRYAAFAGYNGCEALSFAGGATTNSYDSTNIAGGFSSTGGNVGTNGNLTEIGNPTTINGTLSTPRSGVGACTENNVTAQTVTGNATVTGGLVELSQSVEYPTPTLAATPPETSIGFSKTGLVCPVGVTGGLCTQVNNVGATITPTSTTTPVIMGNVTVSSGGTLRLNAGIYVVNSITLTGNATIEIGTGPVILQVAGQNQATPIDFSGGTISNTSLNPTKFQIIYPGTGEVKLTGGTNSAALVYAPNAESEFTGGSDFYGSLITKRLTATGGVDLHYDRNLQRSVTMASNPMMSSFTWKSF